MIKFVPLSRRITRPVSVVMLLAWIAVMAMLVNRSYVEATGNFATGAQRTSEGERRATRNREVGEPADTGIPRRHARIQVRPFRTTEIALIAMCFTASVAMSLAVWLYGMRTGVKALEEMG